MKEKIIFLTISVFLYTSIFSQFKNDSSGISEINQLNANCTNLHKLYYKHQFCDLPKDSYKINIALLIDTTGHFYDLIFSYDKDTLPKEAKSYLKLLFTKIIYDLKWFDGIHNNSNQIDRFYISLNRDIKKVKMSNKSWQELIDEEGKVQFVEAWAENDKIKMKHKSWRLDIMF